MDRVPPDAIINTPLPDLQTHLCAQRGALESEGHLLPRAETEPRLPHELKRPMMPNSRASLRKIGPSEGQLHSSAISAGGIVSQRHIIPNECSPAGTQAGFSLYLAARL